MWPYKPSGVLATIAKMSAQVEEDGTLHALAQQNVQYKNYDRLRDEVTPTIHLGRQTQYILEWHPAPHSSLPHTLTDNDIKLSSKPTSATTLPDDYQKQLLAEMTAIQKQRNAYNPRRTLVSPPPQ